MPELCRFYGIIIRMFWEDHSPPHFHAIYGNHEALVDIRSSEDYRRVDAAWRAQSSKTMVRFTS
jgi:hypothetical protein